MKHFRGMSQRFKFPSLPSQGHHSAHGVHKCREGKEEQARSGTPPLAGVISGGGETGVLMIPPPLLPSPVNGGSTYCTALERGARAMSEITGSGASAWDDRDSGPRILTLVP